MTIIFSTYDVFADEPFQGNQAAVLFDRQGEMENQLVLLAQEFLLPETVLRTQHKNIPVFKFATESGLIERCGHGTLAGIADVVLESSAIIGQNTNGHYCVGDNVAKWKAQIISENCLDVSVVWPERPFEQGQLSPNVITKALRISVNDLQPDLPMCIYNSGNLNALVPVNDISALQKAQPDWELLEALCKEQCLTDIHLYCLDKSSHSEFRLRCRNFFLMA